MNNRKGKNINIYGAGLVGSLLSIYLKRQGFNINLIEKRSDLRNNKADKGRSINLALSHRGIKALKEVGLDKQVLSHSISMKGRMIHDIDGNQKFFPYGEKGQMIYSVSRRELNKILLNEAEKEKVNILFDSVAQEVDVKKMTSKIQWGKKNIVLKSDIILGADGAFSTVRRSLQKQEGFNYSQVYLEHSYKELNIPPVDGKHVMEKNALHIWPREKFMLIALPNPDGSFTSTLFLPQEGKISFSQLRNKKSLIYFFKKYFPDVLPIMPMLENDFEKNPTSSLLTIKCFPWVLNDNIALIGDAAHAIVPFYGQGMNAGFEDCRVMNNILIKNKGDWKKTLKEYQIKRKVNTDAIGELALKNFIEMRDLMGNPVFQLRKKIEALIHERYTSYYPLYSMVTFSDMPYSKVFETGLIEDRMMEEILAIKGISRNWSTDAYWKLILKIVKKYF